MPKIKFGKPPLVEVVFEIKFKNPNLVNFEILISELYSKLKRKYPVFESLKPQEIPHLLLPHVIQNRFRAVAQGYPLYQIGPGVVSFNSNGLIYNEKGWVDYKKQLLSFLKVYKECLQGNFTVEQFERISLRYINKIEDQRMYPDVKQYFSNTLNLDINLNFAEGTDYINNLRDIALVQAYSIEHESSFLSFNLKTITEGTRKLMLDSIVYTDNLSNDANIKDWLEMAHGKLEELFLNLTNNIQSLFSND